MRQRYTSLRVLTIDAGCVDSTTAGSSSHDFSAFGSTTSSSLTLDPATTFSTSVVHSSCASTGFGLSDEVALLEQSSLAGLLGTDGKSARNTNTLPLRW